MTENTASLRLKFAQQRWLKDVRILEVIAVAAIYIACARLGQLFAIEPSNVTPVWIPSGVMLALALRFGPSIWPGVFFGAFFGNIWAYISFDSIEATLNAVASATMNGIGDVICVIVAAELIRHYAGTSRILKSHQSLLYFLGFGALLGPLCSALFGVGGLWLFGHISTSQFNHVFVTWLMGDSAGVLTFTPFLLSWLYPERHFGMHSLVALIAAAAYSLLVIAIVFDVIHFPGHIGYAIFLLLPMLFALLFRYGQRLIFTVQASVLSFAIVATWLSHGPFSSDVPWISLLQLQSFAAAFSIVLFMVAILNLEKTLNEAYLEKHAKELEELYRKDALTGLWNRYRIKEFIKIELERQKREMSPFAVLLIDIDDFKHVNDTLGHLEGDRILTELAALIRSSIREIDFAGRWGGEEFIVITSKTNQGALPIITAKLLQAVRLHDFGLQKPLTVSIGSTISTIGDTELSVIDRADQALYRSKHGGKDTASFRFVQGKH